LGGSRKGGGGGGEREPFGQTETQGSVKVWERKLGCQQMTDDVHTRRIVHATACVFVTVRPRLRPCPHVGNSTYINFERETYGLMSTEGTYGTLPHLSNCAYCSECSSFVS
jgi:hypothetical protein